MPRIPQDLIDRLKAEVSLLRLAQAAGLTLKPSGKDLRALCPFHSEKTPSFTISPDSNTFRCYGCDAHGTPIDWIMRMKGTSFRHAVELLKADLPGLLDNSPSRPLKRLNSRYLPPAVSLDASDYELLDQVAAFYHTKLLQTPAALDYLAARGLGDPDTLRHFRIGFSDRTLGLTLPINNHQTGAALRERLKALSILRKSGHEYFRGCFTVPLLDPHGRTASFYGRRLALSPKERTRKPNPQIAAAVAAADAAGVTDPKDPLIDLPHLYLPGHHRALFNPAAVAAADELILAECPFDALTFWAAGFKNVISAYGVHGFTALHRESLQLHATRRILIAYDNDPAGNPAAETLARELMTAGIECFRIRFPHGIDANQYASKVKPATKSLALLIRSAEWMGKGPAPERERAPDPRPTSKPTPTSSFAASSSAPAPRPEEPPVDHKLSGQLRICAGDQAAPAPARTDQSTEPPPAALAPSSAAKEETVTPPSPAARPSEDTPAPTEPPTPASSVARSPAIPARTPPVASPVPPPPAPPELTLASANEASLSRADRSYRVRGLAANTRLDTLRVNLLVQNDRGLHVDTLDLFHAKARAAFEKTASLELGCSEELLHADLQALLVAVDAVQAAALEKNAAATARKDSPPPMSDPERAASLELLRDPRLIERILADFEAAGIVGEQTNKLVGYLAAISRKLKRPLALVVQSSSSAGKSTIMDAVLDFVPEEEREQFSAMTGQALFYMGQTNLAHKVLAIVEEEGAERASYALKLLQSEGKLKIASTGKDPATGKLVTHNYAVEGPVMIFLTTTAPDLDDELQNRCLILTVDEDRTQTRAIHARQREKRTVNGLFADTQKAQLSLLHQNAQRLLAPLPVVNPFVHRLTFMDDKTRTRRDHEKYLTLIDCIALLFQHQRPVKSATRNGHSVRYIEVTKDDIQLANRLADEVLGRSLDELPPQTRKLLSLLDAMVTQACEHQECPRSQYRFSRRQIRETLGWNQTQLRLHLARLEELEYLVTHRGGRGLCFAYELVYDGRGSDGKPFLPGLIDLDALADSDPQGEGEGHDYDRNLAGVRANLAGTNENLAGAWRGHIGPLSGGYRAGSDPARLHEQSSSDDPEPKTPKNAYKAPTPSGVLVPYRRRIPAPDTPTRSPRPASSGAADPTAPSASALLTAATSKKAR